MKYNAKYDLYVSKEGLVYRLKKDKLALANACYTTDGYVQVHTKAKTQMVHRIVYETFVGVIPANFKIARKNYIRDDNRLENLYLTDQKTAVQKAIPHFKQAKSGVNHPMYGKHHPEKTRQKIKEAWQRWRIAHGK